MAQKSDKGSMGAGGTSDYLQIRRYVIDLLNEAGDSQRQIPSLSELMTLFGVSRPTVCRALRELIADGYLLARRGHGTFTNPAHSWQHTGQSGNRMLPVVGIILSDGLLAYMDVFYGQFLAEMLRQLVTIPSLTRVIDLHGTDPDAALQQLRLEHLQGLIWLQPPERMLPVIERLRAERYPVSTSKGDLLGDSRVVGRRLGTMLLAEGRRQVAYLYWQRDMTAMLMRGIQDVYEAAGLDLDRRYFLLADQDVFARLRQCFADGAPIDAIINPHLPYSALQAVLTAAGVDLHQQCRLVQSSLVMYGAPEPPGIMYDIPFAPAVRAIISKLGIFPGLSDAGGQEEITIRRNS